MLRLALYLLGQRLAEEHVGEMMIVMMTGSRAEWTTS